MKWKTVARVLVRKLRHGEQRSVLSAQVLERGKTVQFDEHHAMEAVRRRDELSEAIATWSVWDGMKG